METHAIKSRDHHLLLTEEKIVNQLLVERNKSGVGSEEIRGLSGVFLEEQYSYSDSLFIVNIVNRPLDWSDLRPIL